MYLAIMLTIHGLMSLSSEGKSYADFFNAFLCGFAFGTALVPIGDILNTAFNLSIGLINRIWAARLGAFDVVYGTATMKQDSPLECVLPF